MSTRAAALADALQQVHETFVAAVEGLSAAQWQLVNDSEGRPLGVLAHHLGRGYGRAAGILQAAAAGQPMPALNWDLINQGNAQHATEYAGCTPAEALDLLTRNGAQALETVRGLSDAQLDAPVLLFDGAPWTGQQVVERVLIGHVQSHLASLQATAAAA